MRSTPYLCCVDRNSPLICKIFEHLMNFCEYFRNFTLLSTLKLRQPTVYVSSTIRAPNAGKEACHTQTSRADLPPSHSLEKHFNKLHLYRTVVRFWSFHSPWKRQWELLSVCDSHLAKWLPTTSISLSTTPSDYHPLSKLVFIVNNRFLGAACMGAAFASIY